MTRLDRYGKGRTKAAFILHNHRSEIEAIDCIPSQEEADDVAAFPNQKSHCRNNQSFCGHNEIRFVLPVHIVEQNNRTSIAHGAKGVLHARFEFRGWEKYWVSVRTNMKRSLLVEKRGKTFQGKREYPQTNTICSCLLEASPYSFIRTVAVGSGLTPDLRTLRYRKRLRAYPKIGLPPVGSVSPP